MQRTINMFKMITSGLRSHRHKNSRSRLTRISSFTISMKKRSDLRIFLILIIPSWITISSIILPNHLVHKNLKTISLSWRTLTITTRILILVFIKSPDPSLSQTRTGRRKGLENNREGNGWDTTSTDSRVNQLTLSWIWTISRKCLLARSTKMRTISVDTTSHTTTNITAIMATRW